MVLRNHRISTSQNQLKEFSLVKHLYSCNTGNFHKLHIFIENATSTNFPENQKIGSNVEEQKLHYEEIDTELGTLVFRKKQKIHYLL